MAQGKNKNTGAKRAEEDRQELSRRTKELKAEKERLLKESKELWDAIEAERLRIPLALQLHLELDLNYAGEEEKETLRRYGRMKEGISRDFIVPGTMTLHALHYAIMRAFGWQNSHIHSFVPFDDEFKEMTDGGKVKEWTKLVGLYFRFPNGDFEDQSWDDDYEEGYADNMDIKTWLKLKYCGPYRYRGMGEHYLVAQSEADRFRKNYPSIQRKTTDMEGWNVLLEGRCEEMIERPMIWTVLKTPADQGDWALWRAWKDAVLKEAKRDRKAATEEYDELSQEYTELAMKLQERLEKEIGPLNKNPVPEEMTFEDLPYEGLPFGSSELEEPACAGTVPEGTVPEGLSPEVQELIGRLAGSMSRLDELCRRHEPEPIPTFSALNYRYDYGDGWEIRITCTNAWYDRSIYARDEFGRLIRDRMGFVPEEALFTDAFGQPVEGEFLDRLKDIAWNEKPVCTAADGMSLVDDVGGVGGFCDFLKTINGKDREEKKLEKDWARDLGWTGREIKPERIL